MSEIEVSLKRQKIRIPPRPARIGNLFKTREPMGSSPPHSPENDSSVKLIIAADSSAGLEKEPESKEGPEKEPEEWGPYDFVKPLQDATLEGYRYGKKAEVGLDGGLDVEPIWIRECGARG